MPRSPSAAPAQAEARTPFARAIAFAAAAVVMVSLVLLAFAWPSVTSDPHDLPIGVVGDDAQIAQIETALDEQGEGVFALERYDDREAAVSGIEHREVYGAIVLGASAATPRGRPRTQPTRARDRPLRMRSRRTAQRPRPRARPQPPRSSPPRRPMRR
ncbi:MAG: hypothetical protein QM606_09885 [Leucobacter sp.]